MRWSYIMVPDDDAAPFLRRVYFFIILEWPPGSPQCRLAEVSSSVQMFPITTLPRSSPGPLPSWARRPGRVSAELHYIDELLNQ